MIKFILGVILGFIVGTVGISGVSRMVSKSIPVVDTKVNDAQQYLKNQSK